MGMELYVVINNVKLASMHVFDRNRGEIDVNKATDIYAPFVRGGPGPSKR